MKWPWSSPRPAIEAGHVDGYKLKEGVSSQVAPSHPYQARLAHPNNMGNYQKWSLDPEVNIALTLLADLDVGVGFYTEMPEGKPADHPNKQKIDRYIEDVNLREDLWQVEFTTLAKGFCPVERLGDYDLKLLPPETFYIYRDKYGKILKYTQEYFPNQVVTEWKTPEEIKNIILFKNQETTSNPYGIAITESIGPLLDVRNQMNVDIGKVLHRLGFPIPVMRTSRDKSNLEQAVKDRDTDEWIFIGNALKDEFEMFTVGTTGSGGRALEKWIEVINIQICEGLHAPLLFLLKNATEASAHVVMESIDRYVVSRQLYIKWRMEKYLFEPQISGPVPQVVWGQPKTGMEKATMTDLAMLLNTPNVANNQKQAMIKQFFPNLPEADWKAEGPPLIQAAPFNQPAKPLSKPQTATPEALTEHLNDLSMGLNIIETNYREHRLAFIDAIRQGDRTIMAYLKRIHREENEDYAVEHERQFKEWVRRLMPKENIVLVQPQ